MTKVIFEKETEVGHCDYESATGARPKYGEADHAVMFAHTEATLNGHSNLLKIEQHCYLRHGDETLEQECVAPKVVVEPAIATREEMMALAEALHKKYGEEAREQIPARFSV